MGVILGFLPFLAFAALSAWRGAIVALLGGAAVSAALIVRSRVKGLSLKLLEVATLVLFLGLASYAAATGRGLSIIAVRLYVDLGLLLTVLASLAMRRPFTIQYAKEQVLEEHWTDTRFIGANYAITIAWGAAFLVMVLAEGAMLARPDIPKWMGVTAICVALAGGIYYTRRRTVAARRAS